MKQLAPLLVLAACTAPVESTTVQASGNCNNLWVCGGNSPIVDIYDMHEFSILGAPNAAGISAETSQGRARIWSATNQEFDLDLKDGRLRGLPPAGGPVMEGAGLVGAYLRLQYFGKPHYTVRIANVNHRHFPAGPHAGEVYESYVLTWAPVDAPASTIEQNICSAPLWNEEPKTSPELLGLFPGEVVLFGGDRIVAATKEVVDYDPTWINIGCAGHALAKMALTGFVSDYDGHAGNHGGDRDAFQATLKMYSADYCGTGRPYTVAGHPLVYTDVLGYVDYYRQPMQYESRWRSTGAECLDRPRLLDSEPAIFDLIHEDCDLPPPCNGDGTFYDFNGTYRISAYAPPPK